MGKGAVGVLAPPPLPPIAYDIRLPSRSPPAPRSFPFWKPEEARKAPELTAAAKGKEACITSFDCFVSRHGRGRGRGVRAVGAEHQAPRLRVGKEGLSEGRGSIYLIYCSLSLVKVVGSSGLPSIH